jgi:ABC-type polysaccharide/polyol phosphate export permease
VSILGYPWSAVDPIIIALPFSAITIILLQYGRRQDQDSARPA